MAGILFIISAPSGSGKSTLVNEVRRLVPGLDFSISYTTRKSRGSEQPGVEYHFTTREEFQRMIAADEFLEWAEVFGNYYGTALSALDLAAQHGTDLLLDIDVQGALQVMQSMPDAVSIFILPPSPEVLERRLRNRSQAEGVANESVIETRLSEARTELQKIEDYKYALVNDILDQAASEMRSIVLVARGDATPAEGDLAAQCVTGARSPRLESALHSFGVTIGNEE
ncbi:MAG TPA: guanylate kinase [Acidobacteriaceae bacterium]